MLFGNAAQRTLEQQGTITLNLGFPASVIFSFKFIKASRQFFQLFFQCRNVIEQLMIKQTGNSHLLNNLFRNVFAQSSNHTARLAVLFNQADEVFADNLLPGGKRQSCIVTTAADEVILHFPLIFNVENGVAFFNLVQRRLSNINISALNQLRHLAIEKRQQQSTNMASVDIGIGHDDNFMIAAFVGIEIVTSDTGAKRGNDGSDFGGIQHLVKTGTFNVQNFTAQRHNRLIAAMTPLFGRTAGGISLNDEDF